MIEVSVNGIPQGMVNVNRADWQKYSLPLVAADGVLDVRLSYVRDGGGADGDRNVFVDKIEVLALPEPIDPNLPKPLPQF